MNKAPKFETVTLYDLQNRYGEDISNTDLLILKLEHNIYVNTVFYGRWNEKPVDLYNSRHDFVNATDADNKTKCICLFSRKEY